MVARKSYLGDGDESMERRLKIVSLPLAVDHWRRSCPGCPRMRSQKFFVGGSGNAASSFGVSWVTVTKGRVGKVSYSEWRKRETNGFWNLAASSLGVAGRESGDKVDTTIEFLMTTIYTYIYILIIESLKKLNWEVASWQIFNLAVGSGESGRGKPRWSKNQGSRGLPRELAPSEHQSHRTIGQK